jgi:4'-phosphopantetheinyl transferase EntD
VTAASTERCAGGAGSTRTGAEHQLDELVTAVAAILPPGVVFEGGCIADATEPVFGSEVALIAGAVLARRREFCAGRSYARRALSRLRIAPTAILRTQTRAPAWPQGVVGSISHSGQVCGVIVALADRLRAVGLDLEHQPALPQDTIAMVCGSDELQKASQALDAEPHVAAVRIFSIKESVYKAYRPAANEFLDFHDVHVEVDAARATFLASIINRFRAPLYDSRAISGHFGAASNLSYSVALKR